MKDCVTIGVIGAGRALELHDFGYKRSNIPCRLKTVMARRPEQIKMAVARYGFEKGTDNFDELLNDPEIDVIDICTPPYAHKEEIIKAMRAGKHVICEKPLTGYFGRSGDPEPIGEKVSKRDMFEHLLQELDELRAVRAETGKRFMYAENFVYAPAVLKAAEIIRAKKSRILYMKGEESLKGSSSAVAGEWSKTGGGIFIRNGVHPLGAILYLKEQESISQGHNVTVKSVIGDMGYATRRLSDYEHRHIAARPHDVEDAGTAIITFTDGSKATIIATDNLLGGSKNYIEVYANDSAINCRLTMNDAMETYMVDNVGMDGVYISEMLPIVTGWNKPFVADEMLRGYCNEIIDFMRSVLENREPEGCFDLAAQVMKVTYAAYYSDEEGRRIDLV
ncbi:MAG: Gfo/Idh/MocA family oxidoreductase [Oscillospiraceae bacterium]|nr:Gfo/Idh/MocA family oxidoreductase [Oscillospiraceae bacterium]